MGYRDGSEYTNTGPGVCDSEAHQLLDDPPPPEDPPPELLPELLMDPEEEEDPLPPLDPPLPLEFRLMYSANAKKPKIATKNKGTKCSK